MKASCWLAEERASSKLALPCLVCCFACTRTIVYVAALPWPISLKATSCVLPPRTNRAFADCSPPTLTAIFWNGDLPAVHTEKTTNISSTTKAMVCASIFLPNSFKIWNPYKRPANFTSLVCWESKRIMSIRHCEGFYDWLRGSRNHETCCSFWCENGWKCDDSLTVITMWAWRWSGTYTSLLLRWQIKNATSAKSLWGCSNRMYE